MSRVRNKPLRYALLVNDMKIGDLAEKIRMNRSTLSTIISNEDLPEDIQFLLSEAINATGDELDRFAFEFRCWREEKRQNAMRYVRGDRYAKSKMKKLNNRAEQNDAIVDSLSSSFGDFSEAIAPRDKTLEAYRDYLRSEEWK